jgi:hypothetical protein
MKKIRWFFAEFFVVVSGVLVAFILNSWWMNIKEHDREKAYLRQIYQDLSVTMGYVEKAQSEERKRVYGGSQFIRSFHSDTLIADSTYIQWTFSLMSFNPGEKVSTTLSSLMTTGDIQLVGNDSLRNGLVNTTEKLDEYYKRSTIVGYDWLLPNFKTLAKLVEADRMILSTFDKESIKVASADSLSIAPNPGIFEKPEPLNWAQITGDKTFRHELFYAYIGHQNMLRAHNEMMEKLEELELALSAELKDRELWNENMERLKSGEN